MKYKTKIMIVVEGGVIQNIISDNPDVIIAVVDYDDKDDENPAIVNVDSPEYVLRMADAFSDEKFPYSEAEQYAIDALTKEGFMDDNPDRTERPVTFEPDSAIVCPVCNESYCVQDIKTVY